MKSKTIITIALIFAGIVVSGCVSKSPQSTSITLNGAGATFPYPLISKWSFEYHNQYPNIQINYQSVGSGAGIRQITAKIVDFGASDAPLTKEEYASAQGILHIPHTLGAVVVAYNLPNINKGIKLSGEVIADIYLGKIKHWNDPAITSLNPDITFPDKEIIVVHRSDGSGTTFIFTDYLSSVSKEWNSRVGKGKSVNWVLGLGGKGNEGVTALVKQNPYSIGYVELAYAKLNNLSYAYIRNREGNFVEPTLENITNAARSLSTLPKGDAVWSSVSIVNAPGKDAYPICSFSYILVYKNQTDYAKGKELARFLWWIVHEGQNYSSELMYAPLPENIVKLNENTIKLMNYKGKPLI